MKVTKLKNVNGFVLLIILVLHFVLLNGLEKILFSEFGLPHPYLLRPSEFCQQLQNNHPVTCLGMPSGHAEIATIISYILYHYGYLSWPLCLLIVLFTCIQRLVTNMHTILQVFVGILFGLFYGFVYSKTKVSFISLLFTVCCIILLNWVATLIVDNKIQNAAIPEWVDKSMYESIHKKQNISFFMKLLSISLCSMNQQICIFTEWHILEKNMDELLEQMKESGIQYDAVVGIKTGGAILSGYLSRKLGIPAYKTKISTVDNDCNKTNIKSIKSSIDKYGLKIEKEYMICEKIEENLQNKNVILIDETVSTGNTMRTAIEYLQNNKKVGNLFVCSLFSKKEMIGDIPIHKVKNKDYLTLIMPWGYDN